MNRTPLYKQTFAYALEHGETAKYNASLQANIACKEAIEAAIRDNYHDCCLDAAGVRQVAAQFTRARIFYVLANTVQSMAHDGRISRGSREWAEKVPVNPEDRNHVYFRVTQVNPGLLDIFVRQTREALEKRPREKRLER